jgi:hypothetical protein
LERTIQEINVALVAKANQGFRQPSSITTTEKAPDVSARIESLQNELETYRDHLAFEREKVSLFPSRPACKSNRNGVHL